MKTIIAGSRSIMLYSVVVKGIKASKIHITEVVSGRAPGVDRIGESFAILHDIPIKMFPACWDEFGKSAGFRRNQEMADYADALIAIWDGKSHGTKDMIERARKAGLRVFVYNTTEARIRVPKLRPDVIRFVKKPQLKLKGAKRA
jgi:hypothetical protein